MSIALRLEVLDQQHRIDRTLADRARESGYAQDAVTRMTPLESLLIREVEELEREQGLLSQEQEREIQRRTFNEWIDFCTQNGPDPIKVMKNFFAVVHALRPDAWGQQFKDMTCDDYAVLFLETKAAHAERVKRLIYRFARKRGGAGIWAGYQKSASASRKYAAAQRGNRNRAGKTNLEIKKSGNQTHQKAA
jgi:hypothetical protein